MRISSGQQRRVREIVERHFGPRARVWLFGSRADDEKRGGDVDLYVETPRAPTESRVREELAAGAALEALFDDGSVDLVIRYPGDAEKPIHRVALKTGLLL